MKRIAHISGNYITNVSLAEDSFEENSIMMAESKALDLGFQFLSREPEIIKSSYLVSPEGFYLKTGYDDRIAFSQMLSLVKEALEFNIIDNDTPQTITDAFGEKKTISTLRFRQVMISYGLYCKSVWDSSN